ncbi:polyprenyl synthetase family protein [Kordiimonas sp. SCSIO 12603]|uniref:polyprenyl synthetase family protein n=1 Tax=Kordiimonas sp. SCSIO 12603 TaxID=2829596 RepID=UPI0021069D0F|nr:farnesyl diphosphate synthase [Kordiimonas sp. SCSIO 12603]UTW57186.1 polyprenyl synthetase family protein [Kordiimonas sp. SCSIO 12603]
MEAALKQALSATSVAVEKVLDPILRVPEGPEAKVYEAMRHAVFNGGKRLRPLLVLASAELFGVERSCALRVAAAIECVHCYSLVHDDLPAMDDDDLRRGKPTVHVAFDEATAILAGDALLTIAFEILSDEKTHPDPRVRVELVKALSKAAGAAGMVGGQMIDLSAEDHDLSEHDVFRLQNMKTGALISFASEAGAIMARASKQAHASLQGYARDVGLAFQIADDLLDVEGTEEEVGKAVGKDEGAGKATLVGILGIERARQQAQILADQAIDHLSDFDDKALLLRAVAHFAINRRT